MPIYVFPVKRMKSGENKIRKMSVLIALLIAILDQVSKFLVAYLLNPGESISIFGSFLKLSFILNEGAAFGFFAPYTNILVLLNIFIVILLVLFIIFKPIKTLVAGIIAGLLLGGSIGNLIDRIRFGSVIDFIDLTVWPAFNIADSALVIGIGLTIGYILGLFTDSDEQKRAMGK